MSLASVPLAQPAAPNLRAAAGRTLPRPPRLRAPDLDSAPEVERFLDRLGLGRFERPSVRGFVGRNDIWAGTTTSGRTVLVKRLRGHPLDTEARLRRLLAFERLARTAALPLTGPACLGHDARERLVAHDYLEQAVSGAELMVAETFETALARRVGAGLAHLHEVPTGDLMLDGVPPLLPSLEMLEGLPEQHFLNASAAELQAWQLLQRDGELHRALRALLEEEQGATKVPAHCDLRVDQILLHRGRVHLVDWEEFRLADAARDLGSFAGEWLYRAMLDVVTTRGDGEEHRNTPVALDAAAVRTRGVAKLERLRPVVEAFWASYRSARHDLSVPAARALAVRATAFAGWHLLDRLLAGAATNPRLQPVQRAAAGVGRTALLAPHDCAALLGLGAEQESLR